MVKHFGSIGESDQSLKYIGTRRGGWAYYKNQAENPDFLAINKAQGRLLLAGNYFSFLSGWMEGAVLSAELAVKRMARMAGN